MTDVRSYGTLTALGLALSLMTGCGGTTRSAPVPDQQIGAVVSTRAVPAARDRRPEIVYTGEVDDPGPGQSIRSFDLLRGRARTVARLPGAFGDESGFSAASFSPDGARLVAIASRITFPGGAPGRRRAWVDGTVVMSADGARRRTLKTSTYVSSLAGASIEPRWTADGRSVITRGSRGAALLRATPGGRARSTGVQVGRYSPDGRQLLVQRASGLWRVDVATRHARRLTTESTPADWSPDGRQIVFTSDRDHHGTVSLGSDEPTESPAHELYIADADGGHPRRVTHTEADETNPRWSPDGRLILFDHGDYGDLSVIRPDGRCQTRIPATDNYPGLPFEWRPGSDTRHVALRC